MRSKLFFLFLLLLFSISILGCSKAKETSKPLKETITLHHYFSGSLSGGISELVTNFNSSQTSYNLKSIPIDHESFKISIIKSLSEGNPPEIYSYWAGARTHAIKDELLPLDDMWEKEELDKKFSSSIISSACKIDEHYYLLPITQHYVSFYYNKKIFTDYKLIPPKTWDEFIAVCEALKQNNIKPIGLGAKNKWPAQFWFDYLLLRTAGSDYRQDLMTGKASYTDPEVYRVFELWHQLISNEYFNDDYTEADWYETPLIELANNEIGMTLMGTWVISTLENDLNLSSSDDFGFFSFPIIENNIPMTALGPIDGLVVPKDALNPKGAMNVLSFLSSKDSHSIMSRGSGALSPLIDADESVYNSIQLSIKRDIESQANWAFNYDLATPPDVAEIGLNLFVEFLTFPDYYKPLLEEADNNISEIFEKK